MASYDSMKADAREQIAQLREQVEGLMRDRVTPVVKDYADRAHSAANTASDYAGKAGDMAREGAETMSTRVREQPLMAVLIAAVAGFLLGRLFR